MQIEQLESRVASSTIEADLAIVGGGPAGLTLAREFFGTRTRVVVLESGLLNEDPRLAGLNSVESVGEPKDVAQLRKRKKFHQPNVEYWSNESQPYGVRCRVLGGSSHAWAGKSAVFDDIDYVAREWVPYSGWPLDSSMLVPYIDRAAEVLNLGPNCYDDAFWELIGMEPPQPRLDPSILRSFFWQFSRSRINSLDFMRFGPESRTWQAPNVRILLNATVTRIDVNGDGTAFEGLEVSTIDGRRSVVKAKAAVLAASAIENARLLLVSNGAHSTGLGNEHDTVGRFLMDHASARIGRFNAIDCATVMKRFGFYGLRRAGRSHMYNHGLVLSREIQEREQLLHCALYMMEDRAPDDPWDALKRLLQLNSGKPLRDLISVASAPGLLAKGVGMRMFNSNIVPESLKRLITDAMILRNPDRVVREYVDRGLPHKLNGLFIDAITEQSPNPESRITLSDRKDVLGTPMARVDWRISYSERHSLMRIGQLLEKELRRAGLPVPILERWILDERPEDSIVIDMAHTLGTTRMSQDPKLGVVNPDCQVHGVRGLFIAGGSVFPTGGHVNPTLMILALAIRLGDHIKIRLAT